MRFRSDSQRRAIFANINRFSGEPKVIKFKELPVRRIKFKKEGEEEMSKTPVPDYSEETWQKEVAGVPKFKIDEYYHNIWNKLKPQFEGRNILTRCAYDGEEVVKRHPPGKSSYTTIDSPEKLSEMVHEHCIEYLPESSKKGDLGRGDVAILDIDNLKDMPERDMKKVTKAVYEKMGKAFGGKPYIINTHGGYHVGVKLGSPMAFKTMRDKTDKGVIEPVEEEFAGLVSKHHGKAPIYLDKTPQKLHGSSKAVGSLNLPDLTITEKIGVDELDSFRRHRLR